MQADSLRRNSLFSLLSVAARLLANALLFIVVARSYRAEGFGQFATAHALSTIFILVADFGFDMYLSTEVARRRDAAGRLVPRLLAVKLLFILGAAAAMVMVPFLQGASGPVRDLTWMFSLAMALWAVLNFMFSVFRGIEQLRHEGAISLATNSALFGAVALLARLGAPLLALAGAFAAARLLGVLLARRKLGRMGIPLRPEWDRTWLKDAWPGIATYGVFFIFGNMFFLQDTVLLSWWKGDVEVGIFQAAFRLIAVALVLVDVAVSALLPTLTRYHGELNPDWSALTALASKGMLFVGLAIAAVLVAYADGIVRLLYGSEEFERTIAVLRVFGGVVFVRYAVELPAVLLTAAKRQHVRMGLVIGATLLNFAGNAYAIPRHGAVGAAVVSLGTNLVLGLAYLITGRDLVQHRWLGADRVVPVCVSAALTATVMGLDVPLWLGAPILLAGVLAACGFLGLSNGERARIFRRVAV